VSQKNPQRFRTENLSQREYFLFDLKTLNVADDLGL